MKKITTLLTITAIVMSFAFNVHAATMVARLIATPANTSTLKETVQGCTTTSVNIGQAGYNTVANLYSDGYFELGYDSSDSDSLLDGDLLDASDIVILTGIWANIDAAATKFRFQIDGDINLGTEGWLKIYQWTTYNACYFDTDNNYQYTYPASFRILKSDMTLNTSSEDGTLRFTLEGYGQTDASLATPPATAPKMKYDMQVKGHWYSAP